MHLALSLPRVEAIDLRPWVPPEHALVISSEHINSDGSQRGSEAAKNVAWPPPADSPAHLMKPSFLTMEFSASPRLAKQKVGGNEVVSRQPKKTRQAPLPSIVLLPAPHILTCLLLFLPSLRSLLPRLCLCPPSPPACFPYVSLLLPLPTLSPPCRHGCFHFSFMSA